MIRRSTPTATITLLAALTTACAPAPAGPTFTPEDQAAMEAALETALAIANGATDWDAYAAAYYAPDAVVLPPNAPAVRGRAAIADFLRAFPVMSTFATKTLDLKGAGDLAYIFGTYHMEFPMDDGVSVDDGKFVEVWKRQADGSWRVAYDSFSSDLPAS